MSAEWDRARATVEALVAAHGLEVGPTTVDFLALGYIVGATASATQAVPLSVEALLIGAVSVRAPGRGPRGAEDLAELRDEAKQLGARTIDGLLWP